MATDMGGRVKRRRKELGVTQEALAVLIGVSQNAIVKIEKGGSTTKIVELAKSLMVTPEWLLTGEGQKEPPAADQKTDTCFDSNVSEGPVLRGKIPVISWVQAGNWMNVIDNLAPGDAEKWINTTYSARRHTFALRINGDSMEPKFPEGAIIVVEPDEDPLPGKYVVVRRNNDNEATFKQLILDGGMYYLKPLNSRYPIMELTPDSTIVGVVKQMVMDF